MRLVFCFFLYAVLLSSNAWAQEEQCAFHGAEYVPQGQKVADSYDPAVNLLNRTLSFVMRLDIPNPDCHSSMLCRFIYIDAFDHTGQKVSTMRLGESWSNGIPRQSFSRYYGQFGDPDKDWNDQLRGVSFHPIGVKKDLHPASINDVPDLLIFPDTFPELHYNSISSTQEWDRYIKFYTNDRVYPDFRGYDFWERKSCGASENFPRKETVKPRDTTLSCGGITSRIASVCENKRDPLCQSQNWYVADKAINLKADFPDDFRVSGWICASADNKPYVIMLAHNGGNCEECERYMMWTADGDYVAGWRNFWSVFREKNFPEYRPTLSSKIQRVIVSGVEEKP